MASGPGSRPEEQPPVLPVKQHRSHSSRLSSVESDCVMLSPVGLQYQNDVYNNVFPEPTDCHAAQCPIHQRYDPHRHQVRFFSDGTPPPVPKKRLSRTLSLPGDDSPPLSHLSVLRRRPQNFDNPLYMLAPIPDAYIQEEKEEFKPVTLSPPAPSMSLSQLSFDTLDEHLPFFFSSIHDQMVVFQRIQHRHLLFLRSMAQSVEAATLLPGEVSSYQLQDFLLCQDWEPKQVGDTVFYSLHSPRFPGRVLGLTVHKEIDKASKALSRHQPSHVNVQDVIASFHPGNIMRNDSSTLQTQDPSCPSKSDCTVAKPPGGGSRESATDRGNIHSFLQKGHSVMVERDLPQATIEDFVQDSRSPQSANSLDYDRQLCVLLLQVLMGSQHLYNICATAAELRPQGILLVWPNSEKREEKDASEMKKQKEEIKWEKRGEVQILWRTRGSPRVVLTPLSSAHSAPEALTYIKSHIVALIQYCLDSPEKPTAMGSVPSLSKSSYRAGLLHVASLLQSESSGPQMAELVATLQVLLWGPRISLISHRVPVTATVHNWLTIKRALLVMKLADRGLIQDESILDWEECMCLQYLSFTDTETVVSVTSQLWLPLNVH